MQPTRCTLGLLTLALGLLAFALVLDERAALAGGLVLLFFLIYRGYLFLHASRQAAGSAGLERQAAPVILRQGATVAVTARARIRVPPGLTASLEDLPPAGSVVVQGNSWSSPLGPGMQIPELRYGISCLATGSLAFQGMAVRLGDPFFSLCIPIRGAPFTEPALQVDPAGRSPRARGAGGFGEQETGLLAPLKGFSVRSFRDYATGDDPRAIDWKLSAKHGRLFVREYAGLSGKHPLLVVDLPDSAVPCPPETRDSLAGTALDAARAMAREPGGCSLMVISGPNLLAFLPEERSVSRIERAIREYHTPVRAVQWFRSLDPGIAQVYRKRLEGHAADRSSYPAVLGGLYQAFLPAVQPARFEVQCARALGRSRSETLTVLSAGLGDASHLSSLAIQARRAGMESYLEIPAPAAGPSDLGRLAGLGFSSVGVIR